MDIISLVSFSFILFIIGLFGLVLNNKNLIIMLMSIEIILVAVNLNYIIFSYYINDILGVMFVILIITVGAAEAAIGLSLLVIYFRLKENIEIIFTNLIRS